MSDKLIDGLVYPAVVTLTDPEFMVYLFGGLYLDSDNWKVSTRVLQLDVKRKRVKEVATLKHPRVNHTAVLYKDKFLVYGGYQFDPQ